MSDSPRKFLAMSITARRMIIGGNFELVSSSFEMRLTMFLRSLAAVLLTLAIIKNNV